MKKFLLGVGAFLLSHALIAQGSHVVLISIDGLRPEFYKDPSWNMVHLRQAMETGAYADGVEGVFPTVTYPSHTTMITGVKPLKHGVYYNTPSEPLGVTGNWVCRKMQRRPASMKKWNNMPQASWRKLILTATTWA